jgi:hypothetical protein
MTVRPAYVMVAAGAGVLLGFGIELGNEENNASSAVLISRFAWRMKYLNDHFDKLLLNITIDSDDTANIALDNFPAVDEILNRVAEGGDQLQRGLAVCVTAIGKSQQIGAPAIVELKLTDADLERQFSHRISLIDVTQDHWDKRPLPRYSIGPTTKKIKHFV